MPWIYVQADEEIVVDLPEPGLMSDWDDAEAEAICEQYGHPKSALNFQIDNVDDPGCPFWIYVGDIDAYDGELFSERLSETSYCFRIHGKFKTKVHKDTLAALKDGGLPYLESVIRFRAGFRYEFNQKRLEEKNHQLRFSDKKL